MDIKNKKVLVTGADGFIGSHMVEMLVERGAKVRALVCYNSFNSWGWLDDLDCVGQVEVWAGDIRDPHYCKKLTEDIDVVFHLAALIAIPFSYVAPQSYVSTNVSGTLNMCQAALDNNCERFISFSTSEVYGSAQYVPIDEKHPLQAQSPYSASKIAADSLALSYYNSFDLPVIIARPFNTFGPRQSARAIIPTIITQIAAGYKKIKLGDLSTTRDLNFVADTCAGVISLAECDLAVGSATNIGSGREVSMGDVVSIISNLMNVEIEVVCDDQRIRPPLSEVQRLCCDPAKLQKLTGFVPSFSLEEGLKESIKWFSDEDKLSKYKVNEYNI